MKKAFAPGGEGVRVTPVLGALFSVAGGASATGAGVSALKMRVQRACDRLRVLLEEDRYA